MSSCSNNLNIFRNSSSTIHNAYLVKLSPEVVEQLKQEARTVIDLESSSSNHSTSQGPKLVITEQGKCFGLKLDEDKLIKLKFIPESTSDVEFYETPTVEEYNNSLWLSGKVKGKLFEEKQLSNKISENMKKRVLEAEKEAHAHDIKVIQPLENKKKNGIIKQTFVGNKRRASLPPVLKRTSSENQLKKESYPPERTVSSQTDSDSISRKSNLLPTNTKLPNSHISSSYRDVVQASANHFKKRQSYAHRSESYQDFTSHAAPSLETNKKTLSLRTFLMFMLLLGPLTKEELEKEHRERFLRFQSDASLSMDVVLEEIAVLQGGKWRLKEDKMYSLVVNDFPLYSGEESQNAEKILQRWKDQRKLCSEEEINAALEAFQQESETYSDSRQEGKEEGIARKNDCLHMLECNRGELLNRYIEKYRLYHSLVSRLTELSKSFEDLRNRFLNSSSAEERQKLRERMKILKDKHSSKWNLGVSLVKNLEQQLIDYKNKLKSHSF